MSATHNLRLPKGSTIFITGVTGYIGAWVAHEALSLGYKVRGAVRDLKRAAWLQPFFDEKFPGGYSQVLFTGVLDVPALESALAGVDGIVHVAVDTTFTSSPEPYLPEAINGTLNVLRAAKKLGVKSVVYTSSSRAGFNAVANKSLVIPKDLYNEEAVKLAWDTSVQFPGKHWIIYAASKTQAEQAAWKWIEENKPDFAFNTILPDTNFGPSVSIEHQGFPSTGGWPKVLFDGSVNDIPGAPPGHFIDVRDTARLHVAALVLTTANSERFWGFAEPFDFNQVLAILRKLWPQRSFIEDIEDRGKDLMTPPSESAEQLLRLFGQDKWTTLEESIRDTLQPIASGQVKKFFNAPVLK